MRKEKESGARVGETQAMWCLYHGDSVGETEWYCGFGGTIPGDTN